MPVRESPLRNNAAPARSRGVRPECRLQHPSTVVWRHDPMESSSASAGRAPPPRSWGRRTSPAGAVAAEGLRGARISPPRARRLLANMKSPTKQPRKKKRRPRGRGGRRLPPCRIQPSAVPRASRSPSSDSHCRLAHQAAPSARRKLLPLFPPPAPLQAHRSWPPRARRSQACVLRQRESCWGLGQRGRARP